MHLCALVCVSILGMKCAFVYLFTHIYYFTYVTGNKDRNFSITMFLKIELIYLGPLKWSVFLNAFLSLLAYVRRGVGLGWGVFGMNVVSVGAGVCGVTNGVMQTQWVRGKEVAGCWVVNLHPRLYHSKGNKPYMGDELHGFSCLSDSRLIGVSLSLVLKICL